MYELFTTKRSISANKVSMVNFDFIGTLNETSKGERMVKKGGKT